MPKISKHFLTELRSRIAVSTIVGRNVPLKKQGREFTGLCPFHDDKNPSLTVNDQKQFYHCFSCGAHGDIVKFVMETQKLGFGEAVKTLATEAGLKIREETPAEQQKTHQADQDLAALEEAAKWFEQQLPNSPAATYLKQRGISEAVIKRFRLGYAPPRTEQFSRRDERLIRCGLVKLGDGNKPYPYFRHRLMFPIFDRQNRIIAFGGRALEEAAKPKYLNSPQSDVFDKSATVYGEPHRSLKPPVYIVEGYMDVIALSKAGINAIAPLGTAMGLKQLDAVWRWDATPIVCFDGDPAGKAAALRLAERALPNIQPYRSLGFVMLADGEDPDGFLRHNDPTAFTNLPHLALADFLWLALAQGRTTPEHRTALRGEYTRLASLITNSQLAAEYKRSFNNKFFEQIPPKQSHPSSAYQSGSYQTRSYQTRSHQTGKYQPSSHPNASQPSIAKATPWLSKEKAWLDAIALALAHHPELIEKVGENLARLANMPPLLAAVCDAPEQARQSQTKMATYIQSLGYDLKKLEQNYPRTHIPFRLDADKQQISDGIHQMVESLTIKLALEEAQQTESGDAKAMATLRMTANELTKLTNKE